ncbi:MAG: signal peptidase I, partial [Cyanobacteriota bacterium]
MSPTEPQAEKGIAPPSPDPTPHDHPEESPWAFWRSVLITLAIALGIRQFLLEARYIPSGSMLPGLQNPACDAYIKRVIGLPGERLQVDPRGR